MPKKSSSASIYGDAPIDQQYTSISKRLYRLIEIELAEHQNKFSELAKRTNVERNSWIQWHRRSDVSEPSSRLIQAAALEWPQYAFWLVTGYSDPSSGHVQPGQLGERVKLIADLTSAYFKSSIEAVCMRHIKPSAVDKLIGEPLLQEKIQTLLVERAKQIRIELEDLVKVMEISNDK